MDSDHRPRHCSQTASPAVEQAKFTVKSLSPSDIAIDVPQALLSNQCAAKINGAITPDGDKLPSWEG